MNLSDFDFALPEELIAQNPLERRDSSRLMSVDREAGGIEDCRFTDICDLLTPQDVLVINNTQVFPARLHCTTVSGARVEIFLMEEIDGLVWKVLARPAKRLKDGSVICFADNLEAVVLGHEQNGSVVLEFRCVGDFNTIINEIGEMPLPHYIKREGQQTSIDRARYQTIYAKERGAIAAPTAGLHFTPEVLENLKQKGVSIAEVTLHVGYGTFAPVRSDDISEHRVLGERCEITGETAKTVNLAKAEGRRVIAVGTTSVRTLESFAENGELRAGRGIADVTITPGHKFQIVDGILTNFHLPKSSLLLLVSAFAGHELIMSAYAHAISERYRFFSYGDCMLIV